MCNGFAIGYQSSLIPNTTTIAQTGDLATQGTIACVGNITAPKIYMYTKTEVDSKLVLKLSTTAIANYYTKSYNGTLIGSYYTKLQVDTPSQQ